MKDKILIVGLSVLLGLWACSDKETDPGGPAIPKAPQKEIDVDPAWSPDGTKIIYARLPACCDNHRDTQWVWGVFLHDVASGTDSLIWENSSAYDFDWSPDGSRIAYTIGAQVYISDLARQLVYHVQTNERTHFPRWSPSGNEILFCLAFGNSRGLYTYDLDEKVARFHRFAYEIGDWLSSCDTVAALSWQGSADGDLCIYSLSSKDEVVLPYINRFKRAIAASPSGNSILIGRDGYGAPTNVWAFDRDSMMYVQLTTEGGNYPAWSPDGEWIVFTKIDPDNGHLWLMRPDGSEKHQITF